MASTNCPKCNKEILGKVNFCPNCGLPIIDNESIKDNELNHPKKQKPDNSNKLRNISNVLIFI